MKMDRYQLMHYLEPVALFAGRILYDVLPFPERGKKIATCIIVVLLVIMIGYYQCSFSKKYENHKIEVFILDLIVLLYPVTLVQSGKLLKNLNISAGSLLAVQFLCIVPLFIISLVMFRRVKTVK